MVGQLRRWIGLIGTATGAATGAAVLWSATAVLGSTPAGAATRLRSGSVHAQLASHVTSGANAVSAGLGLRGSGVMAAVVGLMAVCALGFLVVTFIRRRVTVA